MKSYTDIEQSKRLAEILPIDSADMCYPYDRHLDKLYGDIPYVMGYKRFNEDTDFPCWSLAALLSILPNPTLTQYKDNKWNIAIFDEDNHFKQECFAQEPIDACYEMVVRLHLNKEDKQ